MSELKLSQQDKKEKIHSLRNEVNDFHPFLQLLFPKLPRVVDVHYTHGRQEYGADFILTRKDDTLLDNEYIGAIVKTGKIEQDFTGIERQIDECDEKRLVLNGRKEICLDEIWIVTNESITHDAKLKIRRKYSTRKIKFVSDTEIIKLADEYNPNYWFDLPIKIGEYLVRLNRLVEEQTITFSLVKGQAADFYIDQELEESDWVRPYGSKRKKKRPVGIIDTVSNGKSLFIEGEAGGGKSRMLRFLASCYSNPESYVTNQTIPILVEYKELVDSFGCNVVNFLTAKCKSENLNVDVNDTKFILLIDGVDEKSLSVDEHASNLTSIIGQINSNPKLKAVITSRPLNRLDESRAVVTGAGRYDLVPLSFTKLIQYFKKICKPASISERLFEDIKKSQLFREIPKTPIAAIILANLLNENAKDLPSNLTELYSKYSELMLGRWDISKGLQSQKEYDAALAIILSIAAYFIENNLSFIALDEAKGFFTDYLSKRNLGIDADALFEKVTTRSGIIQKDRGGNRVYFKHKTFSEYFYAQYKLKYHDAAFIDKRIFDLYWRNVYFFYIGTQKDSESTLRDMLDVSPSTPDEEFLRIVNMADYFLAAFSTPYQMVIENLPRIFVEASKLYIDIVKKRISHKVQQFPEFWILWIFQAIIRDCYGYEFFKEGIQEAVLEILTSNEIDSETRAFASFFLSVSACEIGIKNPFDQMITKIDEELPLTVQLALKYEGEHMKSKSNTLNRILKKTEKKIRQPARQFRQYLESLHQTPLVVEDKMNKSPVRNNSKTH